MGYDLDDKTDNDDDIIELTEVIEKGTAVASTPSSNQEDIFGPAMSDLGNAKVPDLPPEMDVDLDALLAQMDSDGGFSHLEEMERAKAAEAEAEAANQAAQESAGGEEFDLDAMIAQAEDFVTPAAPVASAAAPESSQDEALPDMADIDALLAEMDMPEQPADDAPLESASPSEQNAAQMDDLLENIFEEVAPKAKPVQEEDASADLDALFNSVLNDEPAPEPASPAPMAAEKPAPVDVSTMHFGEEKTPSSAPKDDLDALFQDVLGETSLSAADVAKAVVDVQEKDESPVQDPDMELLDTLFGEDMAETSPPSPADMPSGDQLAEEASHMVDEALSFMQDPPPAAPTMAEEDDIWTSTAAVASAVTASAAAVEVAKPQATEPMSEPVVDTATVQRVQSLEERLTLLEEHVAESMGTAEASFTASLQDSQGQMSSVQEELQALQEQHTGQAQRLATLEAQMQAAEANMSAMQGAAQVEQSEATQNAAEMEAQKEQLVTLSAQLSELAQRVALTEENDQAQRLATLEEQMHATEASVSAMQEAAQAEQAEEAELPELLEQTDPTETIAEMEAHKEQITTLSVQLAALTVRVAATEENSQAIVRDALARDVAAREALSSYIEKLESVAKEAVERESEAQQHVHGTMEQLEQALQAQEQLSMTYAQRLTELEERLAHQEKTMQVHVEKVAAAAAAKILREEIAALLAE